MDRSTHPPVVDALHYEFDGWPADDLITTFPCFIVTDRMKRLIENAKASGCGFARVKVSTSDQFKELKAFRPNQQLPQFSSLAVHGVAQRDDFGTTATGGSMIVSESLLEVMKGGCLDHCDTSAI